MVELEPLFILSESQLSSNIKLAILNVMHKDARKTVPSTWHLYW